MKRLGGELTHLNRVGIGCPTPYSGWMQSRDLVVVTLVDTEAEYLPLAPFEAEVRDRSSDSLTLVASADSIDEAHGLRLRLNESELYPSARLELRGGDGKLVMARMVPNGASTLGPYTTRAGQARCTLEFKVRVIEVLGSTPDSH